MNASNVALLHWGFVAWGGLLALLVLPTHVFASLVLILGPQLCWTGIVRHRTRRAGSA